MLGRRKDDEDPFAALRDGGTYRSTPTQLSETRVGGLGAPAAPTRSRVMRGGGWSRRAARLMIAAFVVVPAAVAGAAAIITTAGQSGGGVTSVTASPTPSPTSARPAPAPAAPVSYLDPAGLRAGLIRVEKLAPGARLTLLRIDAASLSTIAVLPGGAAKEIYIGPSGTVMSAVAASGEQPIPISQISPDVVGRLVAEMGSRFHVSPGRIDYMVISSPPGLPPQWIVFSTAPAHPSYSATLRGGNLTALA
jgi:hypothetical protein